MYKCIFKISRKEYKELKSKGLILPTDDVYKAYDYKKRIIYTVYRFIEESENKKRKSDLPLFILDVVRLNFIFVKFSLSRHHFTRKF